MSTKKIESVLSLIEIAENNLKTARSILSSLSPDKNLRINSENKMPINRSMDETTALEVVEGIFDGEAMIGDNGKTYPVPQNYASKTQLVVGDRMKWLLTTEREIFKLIHPVPRERVTGTFNIEGDSFVVLVDKFPNSINILKASATYAMKQLGLQPGDEIAVYIPKDTTPSWAAFISLTKSGKEESEIPNQRVGSSAPEEIDILNDFKLDSEPKNSDKDYF